MGGSERDSLLIRNSVILQPIKTKERNEFMRGREGGRFCFTWTAGLSSFCHFFIFNKNKGWGEGWPPGPIP